MNNLLVGNGINIQFNKTDYTTQQIVLRILKNCDRDDFPSHIIVNFPYLLKNYIGQLFLEARDILEDKYDVLCVYTIQYDNKEHDFGPEAKEALAAAYREGTIFDQLVSNVKRHWKQHNTLISFSPDHGAHAEETGKTTVRGFPKRGDHGKEIPQDLNIIHYMGVVLRSE